MAAFLPPPPLLFLFLVLLPPRLLADGCLKDCHCTSPTVIFCVQRRSPVVPRGVPALTQNLYLFYNGIEALTREDFLGLSSLEMLDLSQNKLVGLPGNGFQPLSSLQNLDLSSNRITHLSQDSFAGLVKLERLYLHNNHIQSIHPAAFQGLENLLELKLQNNELVLLPPLHMPRLLLLDLSFNRLQPPSPADLHTPNLESLSMAGLGLGSLDEEMMASLVNLHKLDVSQNQLVVVPPALKTTQGLIQLNLTGNPVGQLRQEDFQGLEILQELDISNLNLQVLPNSFSRLFPKLEKLTVAGNPFNCLCPLAWFPAWLQEAKVRLGRTEETRCHFPPLTAGKVLKRLEYRDFGCPATTSVTTTTSVTSTTARGSNTRPPPLFTTPAGTTPPALPPPPPPSDDPSGGGTDGYALLPVPASPSSGHADHETHLCPPNTCLNGGVCRLDGLGHLQCACPAGTLGPYCETKEGPSPPEVATTTVAAAPDIFSRQVTSTSISLDLHRYIEARPYLRGVRLTYRNLSGPDRRPVQLNVPPSYPEYTLRGLRPNSTYSVCASPLGDPDDDDDVVVCTEARTQGLQDTNRQAQVGSGRLATMLVPTLVTVLLAAVAAAAAGAICYMRRRRAKGHMDLGCEPSPLELEGVNGALPQKQPDLSMPNGHSGPEYEVPLMQGHCTANNNVAGQKPSYF